MPRKIAVITGVSKGIGAALAAQFKANDFTVVGLSRNNPDHNHCDHHFCVDLTDASQRTETLSKLLTEFSSIDVLINNAGRGHYETWADGSLDEVRQMFELNVFAPVAVTQQLLPALKVAKGSVINISSVAAKIPVACMGAYCASKSAISAFSDTLRMELFPHQIHVMDVLVGRTSTGFSKGCTGTRRPPSTPGSSPGPEKLVQAIFKAYTKRKTELVFPGWYKFIFKAVRWFPNLLRKANLKKWNLSDQ